MLVLRCAPGLSLKIFLPYDLGRRPLYCKIVTLNITGFWNGLSVVVFKLLICMLLQVVAHMMPDLPNVGVERDLESFPNFLRVHHFGQMVLKSTPLL